MRTVLSVARSRFWLLTVALVTIAAPLTSSGLHAQSGSYGTVVCYEQFQSAHPSPTLPNGDRLELSRALNLFRFHRRKEAVATIDAALKTAAGPWRHRVPPDERKEIIAGLVAFRKCVATSPMPALSTLRVHVTRLEADDTANDVREATAAGATVLVEGWPVGVTDTDGSLIVQVPSGEIRLTAQIPRTEWGENYVTLAPGESGTVSIGLHEGKEVTEDSELVLLEAIDDIIPASSPSFTLQFMRDGMAVPLAEIQMIELRDRNDSWFAPDIDKLFVLTDGTLAVTDTTALFGAMADRFDETITVRVDAVDRDGLGHADAVRFRVGQSPLVVTLAAPPSNPGVRISEVEVGISLVGAGIAVQRVSDGNGQFEIASFPHGTIAFDAEVKQDGRYYYGQATMTHFGGRSVTLVLRHVSDLVSGVPALELGPATAERAPTPRRSGGAPQER